jgi:hypothetical protein
MTYTARSFTFDGATELWDGQGYPAIIASGPLLVTGITRYAGLPLDVGNAVFEAKLLINLISVETGDGDERFDVVLQGANDEGFAGEIETLALVPFGAAAVLPGGAVSTVPGRYEVGIVNYQHGTLYRYLRLFVEVYGTVTSGIVFHAFLAANSAN